MHLNCSTAGMLIAAVVVLTGSMVSGKVLFLAHYNGPSADADYAAGPKEAGPVPAGGYKVAGTTSSGRWGGALDLTDKSRNCTYKALGNLDPREGTVDFWFCIDQDKPTPAPPMYHPLFGWYNPPTQPGGKKRISAFEVYARGAAIKLNIYEPKKSDGASGKGVSAIGTWHHLEINWDCTGGDGSSKYNVYLDGKSAIRATGGKALKTPGGFLHLGIWDYAWGHFLHGRLDELRITDRVEHFADFTPPVCEYATPGTIVAVAKAYSDVLVNLKELTGAIGDIKHAAELVGDPAETTAAAEVIENSEAVAKKAAASIKFIAGKLQTASVKAGGTKDDWQSKLKTLSSDEIKRLSLNLPRFQKDIEASDDAIQAARLKIAAAIREGATLDLGNGAKMQLVLVPSGKFVMGSVGSEKGRDDDEGPQRRVTISKPFYMGVTEVTQDQYAAVMGKNPSKFSGPTRPVERVSWNDAVEFCKALSKKTGKAVRLPTEAEWEYACRAGSKTRFSFGDADRGLGPYAWYSRNSGKKTHPVGKKRPNAWGLYDMHGNVWEWCSDWYAESYAGLKTTDPQGAGSGSFRVLRGGSWYIYPVLPSYCRSADRNWNSPVYRSSLFGFRVAVGF